VASVIDTLVMAKEMFPGKRNGLDALCERLGVDNSDRTLHGALLDAELLADVYINLTRGQDSLVMEIDMPGSQGASGELIDLRQFELPVLQASDAELQAHKAYLDELDKASKNKTVWRQAEKSAENAV